MKVFFKRWIKEQKRKIKLVYPDIPEDDIEKFLEKEIDNNCKNPSCVLDNSYIHKQARASLLDIIDYIDQKKPILAGFGVMYKRQDQLATPEAIWLDETLAERKAIKKNLKTETPGTYEYMQVDNAQKNKKIVANAFYGANGNDSSFFYNNYTAPSVTATGQSLISTAETAFESFYANNVLYYKLDDVLLYISNIVHEEYKTSILPEVTIDMVLEKLHSAFRYDFKLTEKVQSVLVAVLKNLKQEDLKKIYYKANLFEFIKIPKVEKAFLKIFRTTKSFKDPNHVPEEIQDDLDDLWQLLKDCVMYDYPVPNRINRLKFEKRKVAVIIDTDSNMLNISKWLEYWMSFEYKDMQAENDAELIYIVANSLCYIMTMLTKAFLHTFALHANIPDNYEGRLNMKNEFFYKRIITTNSKKHYVGIIRLREGKELIPEKLDAKGMDWAKATSSARTKDFFNNLIKKEILYSENIDTAKIFKEIWAFQDEIKASIRDGSKQFLTPISIKAPEAYANPWSTPGIRQVFFWNAIYPEMEIQLPDNVVLAELTLDRLIKVEEFSRRYPDIYHKLTEGVFLNPIFSRYLIASKIRREDPTSIFKAIAKYVTSIAIPINVDIPKWVLDYINMNKIMQSNVNKFIPITEALGLPALETHANEQVLSNIIEF